MSTTTRRTDPIARLTSGRPRRAPSTQALDGDHKAPLVRVRERRDALRRHWVALKGCREIGGHADLAWRGVELYLEGTKRAAARQRRVEKTVTSLHDEAQAG